MQKKKIIVLCLFTALVLAACGSDKKSDKKIPADVEKKDIADTGVADIDSTDKVAGTDNKVVDGEKKDRSDGDADDKDADGEKNDSADAVTGDKDADGDKKDSSGADTDDKDADVEKNDVADAVSDDTELDGETEDSLDTDTNDKDAAGEKRDSVGADDKDSADEKKAGSDIATDGKNADVEKKDGSKVVADDKDADGKKNDGADTGAGNKDSTVDNKDSSNADTGDKNADNKTGDTGGTEKSREQEIIESITLEYASQGNLNNNKIITLSAELRELNPDKADKWDSIMKLWKGLDDSLVINYDILPDGLPETNELCIVVLGFQLNADGTMKDELLQRLTVAKASAEKYPNAYVVCTGGGTAAQNKSVTEAGEMAKWLIKNGIDEKRVIVENKSLTTAHNAIYTLAILGEKYPEVNSIVIVSSDYHIKTGWLLFSAEATLLAEKAGEERIKVISAAAWHAPSGSLTNNFNARALASLEEYMEKANAI